MVKRYAERDVMGLDSIGGYYYRHVSAMTKEALHAKSDIAAELAWRDSQIDAKERECEALRKDAERYRWLRDDLIGNGVDAYDIADSAFMSTPEKFDAAIDAALPPVAVLDERKE